MQVSASLCHACRHRPAGAKGSECEMCRLRMKGTNQRGKKSETFGGFC